MVVWVVIFWVVIVLIVILWVVIVLDVIVVIVSAVIVLVVSLHTATDILVFKITLPKLQRSETIIHEDQCNCYHKIFILFIKIILHIILRCLYNLYACCSILLPTTKYHLCMRNFPPSGEYFMRRYIFNFNNFTAVRWFKKYQMCLKAKNF